jgi:hypothetical protein
LTKNNPQDVKIKKGSLRLSKPFLAYHAAVFLRTQRTAERFLHLHPFILIISYVIVGVNLFEPAVRQAHVKLHLLAKPARHVRLPCGSFKAVLTRRRIFFSPRGAQGQHGNNYHNNPNENDGNKSGNGD